MVSFVTQVGADGSFEARELAFVVSEPAPSGKGVAGLPGPPPPSPCGRPAPPALMGPGAGGCAGGGYAGGASDGQRLQGTVVSYNSGKGFGFLQCPAVSG